MVTSWVLFDTDGRAYCGRCGATRNARGVGFSELADPKQAVRGHLKTCRGAQGIVEERASLAARLAGPPPAAPHREPSVQPLKSARLQPAGSGSQPAVAPYMPRPFRMAAPLPAAELEERFGAEAELRDRLTVAVQEKEHYRKIAEDALALRDNHDPHLALAAAQAAQTPPIVYVLGGAAALGLIAWALGLFDGGGGDPRPTIRGRESYARGSDGGGLGNVLSTASQMLGVVKNVRGAFRI